MEIIEIIEKTVKFSEAIELVTAYKGNLFLIAIESLMIFLCINSFMILTCSQNIIGYILNITFKTICLISFTAALVLQFAPTLVDKTGL